jgi:hypothetical protein
MELHQALDSFVRQEPVDGGELAERISVGHFRR